jgi:heme A synthase
MELIFRITLFVAGIINFIPTSLAFFPKKIKDSYGIDVTSTNLELSLRHRAILLGIVGGLMVFSALSKKYYGVSVIIGGISMLSFIILYFAIGGINNELKKVMIFDAVAMGILAIGSFCYYFLEK